MFEFRTRPNIFHVSHFFRRQFQAHSLQGIFGIGWTSINSFESQ